MKSVGEHGVKIVGIYIGDHQVHHNVKDDWNADGNGPGTIRVSNKHFKCF